MIIGLFDWCLVFTQVLSFFERILSQIKAFVVVIVCYTIETLSLYVHPCIKTNMYNWWRDRLSFLFVSLFMHVVFILYIYVWLIERLVNSHTPRHQNRRNKQYRERDFVDCVYSLVIILWVWRFCFDSHLSSQNNYYSSIVIALHLYHQWSYIRNGVKNQTTNISLCIIYNTQLKSFSVELSV